MHFKNLKFGEYPDEDDNACVSGCYRCLLSYYNQMDHDLLDRRDEGVVEFLVDLAHASHDTCANVTSNSDWLEAIVGWGLPKPETREIAGVKCEYVWSQHQLIAFAGEVPAELTNYCEDRGVYLLALPDQVPQNCPAELRDLFGGAR